MPGTLYVVATPIGNLEDITLRALRILREADLIAAEDTRRTARLIQHYSIGTPTTSLHEHNETQRSTQLLARLREGANIALVSDAGTPLVSDPGARLVRMVAAAGLRVVPVPGPSAITAVLATVGIGADGFAFVGFPPSRSHARKKWLSEIVAPSRQAVVMFEAPHRIRSFLSDALTVLGNRPITVAREMTKVHEELVTRPISELVEHFQAPRGEFTLVVPPHQFDSHPNRAPSTADLKAALGELTNNTRGSKRHAVKALARQYGLSTNAVYRLLEAESE